VAEDQVILTSDAERFIADFKKDPENREWLDRKLKAFDKWRTVFSTKNIDRLSEDDIKRFLSSKENQSWDGIQRQSSIYQDIGKLRETLRYVTNEINEASMEDIRKRLNDVLQPDGQYKIQGLSRAVITAVMHICDERNRIGVWNKKVDDAFEKLGLDASEPSGSIGDRYLAYNKLLGDLGEKYGLSLYQVDMLVHKIATEYTPAVGSTQISRSLNITALLSEKKQIIFYGPPGTGKTFEAQRLSVEFLTGRSV